MWTVLLILCIALPLCTRFLPSVCVYLWLKLKGRASEAEDLRLEIADLKQQQSEISLVDEFAKHSKIGRRINAKTNTLKSMQQNQIWIKMKAYWYTKVAVYLLSIILFLVYRYQPVLYFDISMYTDNTVIYILGYILAFPTGLPGAIGMPVSLFVCNRLVNQILHFTIPDKSKKAMRHEPVE